MADGGRTLERYFQLNLSGNKQHGGPDGKPGNKANGEHATGSKERDFLRFHCHCNHDFHL